VQEIGAERNNLVSFAVLDTNKHVKQAVGMLFSTNHCRDSPSLDVSSDTYSISGASSALYKNNRK
jgi:hypothetical protein